MSATDVLTPNSQSRTPRPRVGADEAPAPGDHEAFDAAGRLSTLSGFGSSARGNLPKPRLPVALGHHLLTEAEADAALAGLRDDTAAESGRTMLLPLLIGAWKRKETE